LRRSTRAIPLRLSAAAALLLVALVGTGCAGEAVSAEGADTATGKAIFQQRCGACHVLADAGTPGQTGPNLDDAFTARAHGFDESTYFNVVLRQMEIPAPPMPDFDEPGPNFLTEEERIAVAAYVAEVALRPGEQAAAGDGGAGGDDPKAVFTASCGSCHTLSDAGTTGTVGPNLDDAQLEREAAIEQIANGGGGMPAFRDQLSEEQIRALAEYVIEASGG
jgi:cbb3-type cytochrome c oxidase subunit III